MKAIVVGAGVGGLATAIRLAADGLDVTVLERAPTTGGKLTTLDEAGWSFDLGPTVLTKPDDFDALVRLAGTTLADEVELVRLDPQVRCRWPDGSVLDVPDDPGSMPTVLDAFSPGAGSEWERFADHVERIWEASERTILAGPLESPSALVSRLRSPLDLARIDGTRTLAKSASKHFDDPRVRQLVGRCADRVGSSPYQAPATLAGLLHVDQAFGCWYVMGGLGRLADALHRAATTLGVEIRTGTDVGRILVDGGRVTGVELADGGVEPAGTVVAAVDGAHLYTDLLPLPKQAKQLDDARRSTSAFVICAAVRGRTDGIAHHNLFFSLHERQEFRYLEAGQMPIDSTIYACVSSVTDPGRAPGGGENWMLVVTTPPAIGIDRRLMTAAVLNRIAERGFDLRERIDYTRTLVPADFEARYRSVGGALHGTSSNGRRAAFARPANRGPVDGLYHVGGTAHPGSGLPMVAAGARIVADLVAGRID